MSVTQVSDPESTFLLWPQSSHGPHIGILSTSSNFVEKKKLLVPLTASKQSSWSLFKSNPRFLLLLLARVCPVTQQEIFFKSKHLTFLRVNSILKETKYSHQRAALLSTNLWGNDAYLQLRAYILEACGTWGRTQCIRDPRYFKYVDRIMQNK